MNKIQLINLIFRAVGVAMGIAVVVLNILTELQISAAITMLGIGLACISISLLPNNRENNRKKKQ